MNLSVLPASCRQKTLSSADETSAARCSRVRLALRRFMAPMRAQSEGSSLMNCNPNILFQACYRLYLLP